MLQITAPDVNGLRGNEFGKLLNALRQGLETMTENGTTSGLYPNSYVLTPGPPTSGYRAIHVAHKPIKISFNGSSLKRQQNAG